MLLGILTGCIASQVERQLNHAFKQFTNHHAERGLQAIVRGILDDRCYIGLAFGDGRGDGRHRTSISDGVTDTNAEALVEGTII